MTIYLGQLGRLVKLYSTAGTSITEESAYTFKRTLEGRIKAQVQATRGRREWSLTADQIYPDEQGQLLAFAGGEWGPGPFVFVSPDAPVMNMMTPEQASCDPRLVLAAARPGGPLLTPDGWAGRSYVNSDPTVELWFGSDYTPVLPGKPVTASVYLVGAGAKAKLYFYDAAGNGISSQIATVAATGGTAARSWVTAMAPASAASCRVLGVSATVGAHPAVTWSAALSSWADGQGCPKAVLIPDSRELVKAMNVPSGGKWSNLGFKIKEVG